MTAPTQEAMMPELVHRLLRAANLSADNFDKLREKYAALLESHAQLLEVLSDTSRCDCYGRYKRYKCQKCTKKAEVLAKAKEITK